MASLLSAFCFVWFIFMATVLAQALDDQELGALDRIKHSVEDPSGSLGCWSGSDYCQWTGITCSAYGTVVGLNVSHFQLSGSLSPFIGLLWDLRVLDISDNHFYGVIPDTYSALTQLEVLDVSDNHLFGPIPQFLSKLPRLVRANFSNNAFSGPMLPMWNVSCDAYAGNQHMTECQPHAGAGFNLSLIWEVLAPVALISMGVFICAKHPTAAPNISADSDSESERRQRRHSGPGPSPKWSIQSEQQTVNSEVSTTAEPSPVTPASDISLSPTIHFGPAVQL